MLTNEHVQVTTALLHHCSAFKTDSVLPARGKLFHSPLKAGSSLSLTLSAVCVIIYIRLFVRIIIMFFRFIYYHFGLEVFTAKV